MLASLGRRVYRLLLRVLPRNPAGDAVLAWVHFAVAHGRLPTQRYRLNDELCRLKSTGALSDPRRVFVTDKEFLKIYVAGVVGDEYNVPTLAVLRTPEEARAYAYPPRCCIKATHLSGHVIIRKAGEPVNLDKVVGWFKRSKYKTSREANYKPLAPKVIVEPLVFDSDNAEDFKFFCLDGEPRLIQWDVGRYAEHRRAFVDIEWNRLPFSVRVPIFDGELPRPGNLDEMIEVARRLSRNFGLVRVDLYSNGSQLYVGEITNCHGGAARKFLPAGGEDMASRLIFAEHAGGRRSDVE